jgi:hypothetical protein
MDAALLPVEHRHRLPALVTNHAANDRPRHLGLLPLELPDTLRHASPELTNADTGGDKRAHDRRVLGNVLNPVDVGHGVAFLRSRFSRVLYFTSSVTLLIFPVNRVSAPIPIPSATGV